VTHSGPEVLFQDLRRDEIRGWWWWWNTRRGSELLVRVWRRRLSRQTILMAI